MDWGMREEEKRGRWNKLIEVRGENEGSVSPSCDFGSSIVFCPSGIWEYVLTFREEVEWLLKLPSFLLHIFICYFFGFFVVLIFAIFGNGTVTVSANLNFSFLHRAPCTNIIALTAVVGCWEEMDAQQEQNNEAQPVSNKKRIALFSLVALVLIALGVVSTSTASVGPMK